MGGVMRAESMMDDATAGVLSDVQASFGVDEKALAADGAAIRLRRSSIAGKRA